METPWEKMRFQKGQSGPPKGRPKGVRNKITASLKEDILEVYQETGGKAGLAKWVNEGKRNRAMFYQWIIMRLLPQEQIHSGGIEHKFSFKFGSNGNGD